MIPPSRKRFLFDSNDAMLCYVTIFIPQFYFVTCGRPWNTFRVVKKSKKKCFFANFEKTDC